MKLIHLFSLLIAGTVIVSAAAAQSVNFKGRYLGAFSNVQISKMSGDCSGISVQLWDSKNGEGKSTISGAFYDASGACPGNKLILANVIYDRLTGLLEFETAGGTPGGAEFKGRLEAKNMEGLFGFKNGNTGKVDEYTWSQVTLRGLSKKEWQALGGK